MNTSEDITKREPCLCLTDIGSRLRPHMSDHARRALRDAAHDEMLPDMLVFTRAFPGEPTDDELRVFGIDLSAAVEQLETSAWNVDGLVSVPIEVPMNDGRRLVVLHARVVGSDTQVARDIVKSIAARCGVHAVEPGVCIDGTGRITPAAR